MSAFEEILFEQQVRNLAKERGYLVRKSRSRRAPDSANYGLYILLNARTGYQVLGGAFAATLGDIVKYLNGE